MKVVKIGGSLERSGDLMICLDRVIKQNRQGLVIVPGGGLFAEQVRLAQQRWGFDEVSAHHMAILAMQQMALLFKALQPALQMKGSVAAIRSALAAGRIALWSPAISALDAADIAASWDITSDSLAAWLATELGAQELVLVKSAKVAADADIEALAGRGIVDPALPRFTAQATYKITIINKDSLSC
ncbi:MAG: uridylate kinase [Gammaproteobacteria bacterium HGW-Gammaproteobacteria-3]|nr:MAG: uridylate kinase [Gammaproteobacteria bacterium HGW-Gammaproteobacteria-3]